MKPRRRVRRSGLRSGAGQRKIHRRSLRRFHPKGSVLAAGHASPTSRGTRFIFSGAMSATFRPTIPKAITAWPTKRCSPKSQCAPENIFRIHAEEKDAAAAALQYEQALKDFFHLSPGQFPRFDLVLLGIGTRRTHRFPFPRHRRAERNAAPGSRQLGAKIQHPPPHFHLSRPECRRLCHLSGQWTRQSGDSPRSSGE